MTALVLLPLLLAPVDTGRVVVAGPTVSVYVDTDIKRESAHRWPGEDKVKHFAFSYLIAAGSAAGMRTFADRNESIVAGAALGMIAGIGKEIFDRKQGRRSSVGDLLWDIAGVSLAVVVQLQTGN